MILAVPVMEMTLVLFFFFKLSYSGLVVCPIQSTHLEID